VWKNIKTAFLLYWTTIALSFGTTKESFTSEDGKLTVQGKVKKVVGDMITLQESISFQAHLLKISEMVMESSSCWPDKTTLYMKEDGKMGLSMGMVNNGKLMRHSTLVNGLKARKTVKEK
jgi:hypothetical protein